MLRLNKKGFTLVEYVIYIGVSAIVLTSLVTFTWGIINDQIYQQSQSTVDDAVNMVIDNVIYDIQKADNFDITTQFDIDPGTLVLNMVDGSVITYEIFQQDVLIGGRLVSTNTLKKTLSTGEEYVLTADRVNVDDFILDDMSNDSVSTIRVTLTIKTINDKSQAYAAQQQVITSATIR